jgi:hypothetical protein
MESLQEREIGSRGGHIRLFEGDHKGSHTLSRGAADSGSTNALRHSLSDFYTLRQNHGTQPGNMRAGAVCY